MNMISKIEETNDVAASGEPGAGARWRKGAFVGVPLAVLLGGLVVANREAPPPPAPPAPTVTVAQPLVRDVNEWDDYVGRFEASRAVEVRPRVSGQITAVHFTDGQTVHKGQVLFTIDPRPFAAALAEARARLASAESDLALARADLGRAQRLLDDQAVSQSEVDRLQARVRAAVAAVAGAQARVRSRALDLEFTQVRAPIGGRVSDRRIDPGNLVIAGDGAAGSLLTTINALDPIYFSFDASEALFLKAKRAQEQGAEASRVEIRLQDEPDYRWKGRLDFTDNGIDPRSGTIRGRAVLDNPGMFLTPGMFGNMRLASGGTVKALLVPDAAVQTDQARKIVLVVGKDGTVAARPVAVGALVDGLRVIRSGLTPVDRVVISGTQLAAPGAKVQVRPGQVTPQRIADAPAIGTPPPDQATFAAR
ncbi:efflux RND transporter periplasmic adaptor subunit [Sphingomonas sp. MAH-20]|uniref:Efflux RND transporter periplasmic adaptor subunit n=1 Tax=Sphingomonas horti TaxID=2682842 RepID=A0A6I4IYR3_9SPHN|nr:MULTISPECIES: efflux RND transporter periplasmic adaptor subunit [Sphingomonas]MBA2918077.1 efflux RND transporter periplasmic adaptor subunit [Sphingomonas sp. CGMCC 1.13658]MVO77048.1 efflux RND transporter periplasmic adaptor subunit [Sphingomonas horti]